MRAKLKKGVEMVRRTSAAMGEGCSVPSLSFFRVFSLCLFSVLSSTAPWMTDFA